MPLGGPCCLPGDVVLWGGCWGGLSCLQGWFLLPRRAHQPLGRVGGPFCPQGRSLLPPACRHPFQGVLGSPFCSQGWSLSPPWFNHLFGGMLSVPLLSPGCCPALVCC